MALHLTSRSILAHAKHALEEGPARTTAISVTSSLVGLTAGKREDAKKVPIAALAVGVLAKVGHFHTIGDGLMSGGATILGYKIGARMARKERPVSPEMPKMPPKNMSGPGPRAVASAPAMRRQMPRKG
jgi:hypothetical protein